MDGTITHKVSSIRDGVAERIGENRYRTWFGESTEFVLDGESRLHVQVANPFVGQWIASNFLEDIVAAARSVLGEEGQLDVRIVAPENGAGRNGHDAAPAASLPSAPSTGESAGESAARRRERAYALRSSLDGFVVGPSNRLAYAAAQQVARSPGEAFKLLVLHGGCGLGKTHLLQGICNAVLRNHATLEWRYVSGEEFTNEFIYAVKNGKIDLFRSRFRRVDLLVIDDIHFLANKKATQEEFLHTFNAIDAAGKAIVLSTDRHPRSIATLSEPLINRLISGMVVEVLPPDVQTRREILKRRAALLDKTIGDDVIDFVAQHVSRNVRELEGALYKLIALASLTKERVTVDLAKAALEDHLTRERRNPHASDIERVVGHRFGVTREQIHSGSRDRTVALARAVSMYLVRKHTHLSFPEIGRVMGKKNHSTVLMATQRIERVLGESGLVRWKTDHGVQQGQLAELMRELEADLFPHG